MHTDSYATIRGGQLAVPPAFTVVRDGQAQTIDEPVYVFRSGAELPAEYALLETTRAGDELTLEEVVLWQNCAAAIDAAILAGQPTALGGAIEIHYPGASAALRLP